MVIGSGNGPKPLNVALILFSSLPRLSLNSNHNAMIHDDRAGKGCPPLRFCPSVCPAPHIPLIFIDRYQWTPIYFKHILKIKLDFETGSINFEHMTTMERDNLCRWVNLVRQVNTFFILRLKLNTTSYAGCSAILQGHLKRRHGNGCSAAFTAAICSNHHVPFSICSVDFGAFDPGGLDGNPICQNRG